MMKKINNIYKILLLLPLITMIGCDDNDDIVDVITQGTTTTENTVFIETDDASQIERVVNLNDPQTFSAGVNIPIEETDVNVSFSVTKDGAPAVNGVDYMVDGITIPKTMNEAAGTVTFLEFGLYEVMVKSTSETSLEVVENKLVYNALELPTIPVSITLTWDDSFFDYDLYLVLGNQNFDGMVYGSSLGVSTKENITEVPLWGDSSLFIDDWWGDNAGTPCALEIEYDGVVVETFEVTMDMDKWALIINADVDSSGDPVYTYTLL